MWLLNTRSYYLQLFNDPSQVTYAILSHVWSKDGEQSFQDVMRIHEEAGLLLDLEDGLDTSNYWDSVIGRLSPKIKDFCDFALENGFEWVWLDTCCIDKTSSAELS